ncbi:flagellar basal-body rod protein FlgG [Geobacter sulfurreducens]|jgi:flagellar basal-body rod protein FlgG|uniref:Flagellar basal-body rod protein FlgG n=1 Tax=Geobacter sulfurreducens (strain ATCC 51573 / DSM 12127 / PCA) TaxID=243231 RepID=Q748F1_GEOSL|nr:flagellar basal-body rod protein FlgG [Geobacter sulfurreducens]AAR36443.1 flagellar basal body rod protein FlgG [Geobacter sulfurreducens PCA]ADI85802.1 flagellar basal body rod protein FlgG [Geobacter sulfurreducens KN400]AJY69295.1 flagellar basal body rod protein FlgG [Geobacter sulfurreducens]QVW34849.1 flagellar basal-body rod protein FlgG [Geobacter sulfurreducens]UAC03719.1 flagellar basal-body rod protein FlgG [Geobacter sulfurreducens]
MIRALWTAASGMQAQQTNIDVVANNLANVNTAGFKKSRADFQDLMYQNLKTSGAPSTSSTQVPSGIQIGLGAKLAAVTKLFSEGNINQTGNELDIAIEGDGFFQIQMPDGTTTYSRAGSFKRDDQGRVVTSDGYPMLPELVVPSNATSISVGNDGTVSVTQAGQTSPTNIGNIQLATFSNPSGLTALGRNLFQESDSSGTPTTGTPGQNGIGTLAQGFLEMSNVSVMEEMVNMIVGQRAYEVNSKAVQAADEMLQQANNLRR